MYQVEIAAAAVLTASHCTHKKQKLFFYPIVLILNSMFITLL